MPQKNNLMLTEEQVLDIIVTFAYRVDTHYMVRDYDKIKKEILELGYFDNLMEPYRKGEK